MEQRETLGIVLRSTNYKESDKLLTLLTRDFGVVHALARGCRKQGSHLLASADVFCCAQYSIKMHKGRAIIVQTVLKDNFYALRKRIKALMAATVFAEVCEYVAMPENESARLVALLGSALFALANGANVDDVLFFFSIKLLDILGATPMLDRCVSCGSADIVGVDINEGGAVCENCGGVRISQEEFALIQKALKTPSKNLSQLSGIPQRMALLAKDWMCVAIDREPRSLKLFDSI